MFEKEVFWKDSFNGEAKGGLHFRSFDLNQFIKKVEEDGTEGTFREYCLNKGFKNGCSTGCIEEALRSSSTKLHYRAGLAHAFCSSKR